MQTRMDQLEIQLTSADLESIRTAIQAWGKPREVRDRYDEAMLRLHFMTWLHFVERDWSDWDASEYDHDLGSRFWIQLAIEHSQPATRQLLERVVAPLDERFRARMTPAKDKKSPTVAPLAGGPYFWETHTVHPDLAVP